MRFAFWLVAVAIFSCIATFAARAYAVRRQLVDQPGVRRSHAVATPRGGGVGPVLAFAIVLVVLIAMEPSSRQALSATLAGLFAVAAVGFWDDHRPLSPTLRLGVHLLAGALLAAGFGLWSSAPLLGIAVTAGAVVLVNVWNFMDGIDGIAASQALIVAGCAVLLLDGPWAAAAAGLAAACAGFLPANFPRARIFLGDVGSGAIGFGLAALGVACLVAPGAQLAHAPLLALPASAFLVDSGLTLARRAVRGERWWTPHTQHLYQAASRSLGHVRVTLMYAAVSLAGTATAWAQVGRSLAFTLSLAIVWYMASAVLWLVLQQFVGQGIAVSMEKDR